MKNNAQFGASTVAFIAISRELRRERNREQSIRKYVVVGHKSLSFFSLSLFSFLWSNTSVYTSCFARLRPLLSAAATARLSGEALLAVGCLGCNCLKNIVWQARRKRYPVTIWPFVNGIKNERQMPFVIHSFQWERSKRAHLSLTCDRIHRPFVVIWRVASRRLCSRFDGDLEGTEKANDELCFIYYCIHSSIF